jgi:Ca2+:H+ antiporter
MIRRWRKRGMSFDVLTLVVATALVAVVSELLTGAIEPLSRNLHLSAFFVGLIVLPLVGGAAEYATAVRAALADHMEATMAVTAGSSIQIALLIAPLLILVSPLLGPTLDLDFTQLELVIFGLVAGLFALISLDGESTWLEGLQLCVFYLIVAVGAFFITG